VACAQTKSGWSFRSDDLDSPDVQALLELHFASMRSISPPDACHVLTLWSLREDGRLLGIGALKQLAHDHGEVKSMRTTPDALGRGVGSAMLAYIVAEARSRGYTRLSLETGSTDAFAAALSLYRREGFVPCGPFGGYQATPFTRFLTRTL
jgi:putative acetyltransferase